MPGPTRPIRSVRSASTLSNIGGYGGSILAGREVSAWVQKLMWLLII